VAPDVEYRHLSVFGGALRRVSLRVGAGLAPEGAALFGIRRYPERGRWAIFCQVNPTVSTTEGVV
jgi:hypothetical protein